MIDVYVDVAGALIDRERPALRGAGEAAAGDGRPFGGAGFFGVDILAYQIGIGAACPEVAVGEESQEVALVRWNDIPWDDLAFPTNHWALRQHRQVEGLDSFPPFTNPPRR